MTVIVAQLLEGGGPVSALVPRVLKARRVHHHDGGHGEVVGGEGSGGRRGAPRARGILEPFWSRPPAPPSQRWRNQGSMLGRSANPAEATTYGLCDFGKVT